MRVDLARDVGGAMAEDELRDFDVDACIVQARGAGVAAIVREVLAREELERV